MHHHKYNTEAFVLGSTVSGEGSKYVYLFTKDLGMVGAHAQNMRSMVSKFRPSLQDFSYAKVSLVRGKNIWRVTGASYKFNVFSLLSDSKSRLLCVNIFTLLKKLLPGEEKNNSLFQIVKEGMDYIIESRDDRWIEIELVLVLRILNNLGYAAKHPKLSPFALSLGFERDLISKMENLKNEAISYVNQAIKETQL